MADIVKIILDADNKASGPIDSVSKSLGGLGSIAGGAMKLGLMAGTAALAAATAALGFMLKGAMESELAVAQLDATLRSTAKASADWAAADAVKITGTRDSAEAVAGYRAELDSLTLAYEVDGAQLQEQRQKLIALTAQWGANALNVRTDTAELKVAEAQHAKMGASIGSLQQKIASGAEIVTRSQADMLNMVKPALQLTRAELIKYAEAMQKVTRFDDEVILGGESLLLTFTSIGKDIFPAAMDIAMDMSTVFGTDLQGSITQVGKALQDPILGITALRRVGVNFNEAQTEVIKKMVETGDAAGAQAAILKELQTEFGGSAKAAGQTFAGQLDILKNSIGSVAEDAGLKLLPKLKDLATGFLTLVQSDGFKKFADTLVDSALKGAGAIERIVTATAGGGVKAGVGTALTIGLESGALTAEQAGTIAGFYGQIESAMAKVQLELGKFKVWLDATLPAAILGFSVFWTETLMPPFQNLWDSISDPKTGLMPAFKLIGDWLSVTVPLAIKEFNKAFGKEGAQGSVEGLKLTLIDFVAPVQGFLDLLKAIDDILWSITNAITASYDAARGLNALGMQLPKFPGFASGTPYATGGLAMVGESGPELMYVPRGSRVWPNGQGPDGGGFGGGMNLTLVYSPVVSLADEYEARDRLQPFIRDGVRQAMEGRG
jgi:hypothetical protein